jgi:hypothetical protein
MIEDLKGRLILQTPDDIEDASLMLFLSGDPEEEALEELLANDDGSLELPYPLNLVHSGILKARIKQTLEAPADCYPPSDVERARELSRDLNLEA